MRECDSGQSLTNPKIKVIQGAGAHSYQNMIFAKDWVGNVFVPENLRPTKFVYADGFHGFKKLPHQTNLSHVKIFALRGL